MKIIISHDVDHLYWSEHYIRDLFIPKLILRSTRQWMQGNLDLGNAIGRVAFWNDKRLNRISELTNFLSQNSILSHFFFGMDKGLGLSYSYHSTKPFITELLDKGHYVGVHGINFSEEMEMKKELNRFYEITGTREVGIRMHYLRMNKTTPGLLNTIGYRFDSTLYDIRRPFKWKDTDLWEFPIGVMESYAIDRKTQDFESAKSHTKERIKMAEKKGVSHFVVNFHDTHFDPAYSVYKDWFVWLVEWLVDKQYHFSTFQEAIIELNNEAGPTK